MKFNITVPTSGSRHRTHSFFTFPQGDPSHLARPHRILCGTKKQTGGWPSKRKKKYRTCQEPSSSSEVPSADNTGQGIIVLKKKNTVWAKQKETPYFSHCRQGNMFSLHFTVLQKWVSLAVKDSGFVKLPINKTVFTGLPMAAQGDRDTFIAPIPITHHLSPRCREQIQVTTAGHWGKSKDIRAKSSHPDNTFPWVCLRSRKGLLISCNLVCWQSTDSRCKKKKSHTELQIIIKKFKKH